MATSRWCYETATGRFVYGGFYDTRPPQIAGPIVNGQPTQIDDPAYGVAAFVDAHPDPARERYDGTSPTLRRLATQAELDADAAAALDATAKRDAVDKDIKATVVWTLKRLLQRNPTAAEIDTARQEWIAVYKAL